MDSNALKHGILALWQRKDYWCLYDTLCPAEKVGRRRPRRPRNTPLPLHYWLRKPQTGRNNLKTWNPCVMDSNALKHGILALWRRREYCCVYDTLCPANAGVTRWRASVRNEITSFAANESDNNYEQWTARVFAMPDGACRGVGPSSAWSVLHFRLIDRSLGRYFREFSVNKHRAMWTRTGTSI